MSGLAALQGERALAAAAIVVESVCLADLHSYHGRDISGVLAGSVIRAERRVQDARDRAFRLDLELATR